MHRLFGFFVLLFFNLSFLAPVFALEEWETVPLEGDVSQGAILNAIPKFVQTPEGGVPWEVLGKTSGEEVTFEDKNGETIISLRPVFPKEVKELNGKIVKLQGFMFPLEQSEKQGRFLFGPFPMSCPYHYHVGPNMVIEVHAKEAMTFSFDPLVLAGKLELVESDDEYGVFYRLRDAVSP